MTLEEKIKELQEFVKESLGKTAKMPEENKEQLNKLSEKLTSLEETLAKMKEKKVDTTVDVFSTNDEEKAERFVKWFKFITNPSKYKALGDQMNETNEVDGGFTVPEEFSPSVLRLIDVHGLVSKYATKIPMNSNRMVIPRLTAGITVYWVGEATEITKSKAQGEKVILNAKKLGALVPLTDELLEDTGIEMANLIMNLIGEAFAKEEDRVAFAGNVGGGDPFDGILYKSGVSVVTMGTGNTNFSDLTYDNLIDLETSIKDSALDGATYIMHRKVLGIIKKLKDNDGRPIWTPPKAGEPGEINGYPYIITDVMPSTADSGAGKPFIAFGNLKHIILGGRKDLNFRIADHTGFAEGVQYLRGIIREAISVSIPEAFARLETSNS